MGRLKKLVLVGAVVPAARWAWGRYGDDVRTMRKGRVGTAVHRVRRKMR